MSDTVRVSKGKLDELISVARSINRGKAHEIRVPGDMEPWWPKVAMTNEQQVEA